MRAEPHYKTTIDLFVAPITGQQLSVAGLSAVPVSTLALVVETGRHPRSGLHRDVTLENGVRQ